MSTEYLPYIQKALVGALVAFVGTLLAQYNLTVDMSVQEVLVALGNGIVTGILVWWKKNKV